MIRNNLTLEILAVVIVLAAGVSAFFILPVGWYIAAPVSAFASHVVLETLLPKIWETPPDGVRYEPGDDE